MLYLQYRYCISRFRIRLCNILSRVINQLKYVRHQFPYLERWWSTFSTSSRQSTTNFRRFHQKGRSKCHLSQPKGDSVSNSRYQVSYDQISFQIQKRRGNCFTRPQIIILFMVDKCLTSFVFSYTSFSTSKQVESGPSGVIILLLLI